MKHCNLCVMPDTRPKITFDEEGVCIPCRNAEKQKTTDWRKRKKEWADLCSEYRDSNRQYDCILPSSGGKDSHVQAKALLDQGMSPLVVCVSDWFGHTRAGESNFKSMCSLGMDSIVWRQDPEQMKQMVRTAFLAEGCPTWPIDAAIYAVPIIFARQLNISLVVYGENIAYQYGGPNAEETPYAHGQTDNNVVKPFDIHWWHRFNIWLPEWLRSQSTEGLIPVYLSYFFPWDGHDNMESALRLGFRTADGEWNRQGCIENYDQIDSLGYMVHPWLKYPKYGHQRVTDVASNWIRAGRITRAEAVDLVNAHDHKLDLAALDDFLSFTGFTTTEFWDVVDRLYNRDIFHKDRGSWKIKPEYVLK